MVTVSYGGVINVPLRRLPYNLNYSGFGTDEVTFQHQSGIASICTGIGATYQPTSYRATRLGLASYDQQILNTPTSTTNNNIQFNTVVTSATIEQMQPTDIGSYAVYSGWTSKFGAGASTARNVSPRNIAIGTLGGSSTRFPNQPVYNAYGSEFDSLLRFHFFNSGATNSLFLIVGRYTSNPAVLLTNVPTLTRFIRLTAFDNSAMQIRPFSIFSTIPDVYQIIGLNTTASDPVTQVYSIYLNVISSADLVLDGGPSGSNTAFQASGNKQIWKCGTHGYIVRTPDEIYPQLGTRYWYINRDLTYWYDLNITSTDSALSTCMLDASSAAVIDNNGTFWFKSTTNSTSGTSGVNHYNIVGASQFLNRLILPQYIPGAALPHYYKYDDPVMRGTIYG